MYAWVAGSSSASRSPWATSSSTHMIAGPPASETTATRSPRGIGCSAKAIARSKSSSIEFARRTPVWENTASAARSEPPREPVWDTAARLPASERPDFTAMTGLSFAVSRAIRTKFLGLPKFSMYARISFVSRSPCHIRRRSLRLTWALFPNEQNFAKPTPRDFAWSRMSMPRAPLCVASEIPPGSGGVGERRIHADVGVGVDHAHAVRADHRHVVRVAHREESRLAGHSDLPDFSEAGGDHDEPFHSLLPAVLDGFECDLRGYGDDREIDGVGYREHARVRADPMDARRLRIHRVDRPLVLVHNEIVEDFVADLSSMTRSADDCDGRRREDCVESGSGHRGAKPPARLEGSRLSRCVRCYPVLKSVSRGITAPFE